MASTCMHSCCLDAAAAQQWRPQDSKNGRDFGSVAVNIHENCTDGQKKTETVCYSQDDFVILHAHKNTLKDFQKFVF